MLIRTDTYLLIIVKLHYNLDNDANCCWFCYFISWVAVYPMGIQVRCKLPDNILRSWISDKHFNLTRNWPFNFTTFENDVWWKAGKDVQFCWKMEDKRNGRYNVLPFWLTTKSNTVAVGNLSDFGASSAVIFSFRYSSKRFLSAISRNAPKLQTIANTYSRCRCCVDRILMTSGSTTSRSSSRSLSACKVAGAVSWAGFWDGTRPDSSISICRGNTSLL